MSSWAPLLDEGPSRMSDLLERAREDLSRLEPDAWFDVYAERLIAELDAADGRRVQEVKMQAVTVVLRLARRAMEAIAAELDTFEKTTGWEPDLKRKLKLTPQRWTAARTLALSTRTAVETFLRASRTHQATITRQPGRKDVRAAAILEAALEEAQRIAPPSTGPVLKIFERSTLRLRNRMLHLQDHPVGKDPAFLAAGSVEAVIEDRGQCQNLGEGGRCWFYDGHPGEHQHRRGPKTRRTAG